MHASAGPPRGTVRVVHVAQSIAGGVASFLEEVAGAQAEAFGGENVHFVIPAGSEGQLPNVDTSQITSFAETSRSAGALRDFARTANAAIRRLDPDVVHLHSSFAGAVIRATMARRAKRPRIIYCPHGWAFSMDVSPAKKRAYAAFERLLARRTDVIIVNSQSEYDVAMEFRLPAAKIRVVKNAIAWAPLPERPTAEGPLRIGFIGRHDHQKGLDILLRNIADHQNIHLDVVGDRVLTPRAENRASSHENITFHGWLSRAETLALLKQLDAVVMPSRWEAAGLVALEAMRAGVPVIASDRGALPEVVEDGVGGFIFELERPESLGRILQRLDRTELRALGLKARARWEREYVADRMNELTCNLYREIVSNAGLPRSGVVANPRRLRVNNELSGEAASR
jgi:glycosyltransferase involved in cell wall biosynthesis